MKHHRLTPHLTAQELARRQRWIFVGVAIIALLLVGIWMSALPNRFRAVTKNGISGVAGQLPERGYIDIDKMLGN